jgi:hypothetical protein
MASRRRTGRTDRTHPRDQADAAGPGSRPALSVSWRPTPASGSTPNRRTAIPIRLSLAAASRRQLAGDQLDQLRDDGHVRLAGQRDYQPGFPSRHARAKHAHKALLSCLAYALSRFAYTLRVAGSTGARHFVNLSALMALRLEGQACVLRAAARPTPRNFAGRPRPFTSFCDCSAAGVRRARSGPGLSLALAVSPAEGPTGTMRGVPAGGTHAPRRSPPRPAWTQSGLFGWCAAVAAMTAPELASREMALAQALRFASELASQT